jgi:ferredoxin-NADP reductase
MAGGVGATPLLSTAHSLLEQHARGRPLQRVEFVWTMRDPSLVGALDNSECVPGDGAAMLNGIFRALPLGTGEDLTSEAGPDGQHGDGTGHPCVHVEAHNTAPATSMPPTASRCNRRGRPDLSAIMNRMAKDAGAYPVAVLVCGPQALIDATRAAAAAHPKFALHYVSCMGRVVC